MERPDPADVRIERLVEPSDINPEDRSGTGLLVMAPWEFMLMGVAGRKDAYSAHWCCPRCLDPGSLGHETTIKGHGMQVHCRSDENRDERDYLQITDEHLGLLKKAGDLQVTVNPSIGCRCCGFHCYLEENAYQVLSDWTGADEERDPAAVFTNRIQKLNEHRPGAFQRLSEFVEGGA